MVRSDRLPMDENRARWSDLPPELWTVICKRLETYIDVLRCRAVCRSWRSSLPPFNAVSPLLPLQAPWPPKGDAADYPMEDGILLRQIIYRISPLHHPTANSDSSISSPSPAKGWFAMVERTRKGKLIFMRPLHLSCYRFKYEYLLKEVNLLDFRIHEVAKTYTLVNTQGFHFSGIRKVVMFPDSPWIDAKSCTLVAIFEDGKLGLAEIGDLKWTMIAEHNFVNGDLIAWRGQFYSVDGRGMIFRIDSSMMKLVKISSSLLCGSGIQKHLVECSGQIYVVDQFDGESVDFKVYEVDLNAKILKEVKNLRNEAFVLGKDVNFSVSETDCEGIQRNCIYYPREFVGVLSSIIHVFDLEERILKSDNDEQIFTPAPMLLAPDVPADRYGYYTNRSAY